MLIYGKNSVFEAIKSKKNIEEIFIRKGLENDPKIKGLISSRKFRVSLLSSDELNKLTNQERNQGIACQISDFKYCSVEDIIKNKKGKNLMLFILDSIEDPHNLGSIIRVAECLNIDGIIIPKNRSVKVNETVYKTSAGAVNNVKIAMVPNINYTIDILKDNFINIVSTAMNGENIYTSKISGDVAIVIGNEGAGIHSLTLKKSDKIVTIPMEGKINSLNASVATGIVAYEIYRKNNF